jgi:electron transfer flavoprotein beta subunit
VYWARISAGGAQARARPGRGRGNLSFAARVLAAAIQKIDGVDMVVFGRQTLDNGAGVTPAQTARVLGWPMLGLAGQIKVQDGTVTVDRVIEEGRQTVSAKLPAVVSVVQSIGEPRYPSFMGIRKASKANIPVWSLGELGIRAPEPVVRRTDVISPPARETTVEIITGDTPQDVAETLVEKILAEKVL